LRAAKFARAKAGDAEDPAADEEQPEEQKNAFHAGKALPPRRTASSGGAARREGLRGRRALAPPRPIA